MPRESNQLDVLIIGGGIHGMYLFHLLRQKRSELIIKIADPHPAPFYNWRHCTSNTGMRFLRSTGVHHLDVDPLSLQKFYKKHGNEIRKPYISPNNRPSLSLFNNHSDKILSDYDLDTHWVQTHITDIDLSEEGVRVNTLEEEIHCKHVILAIGNGGQLRAPFWAEQLAVHSFPILHIYSSEFEIKNYKPGFHSVIVGNGMGAVQAFIKLANSHSDKITLITPSQIKVAQYDIDPGWMGPKYLTNFHQEKSYQNRRKLINSARQRGTITPEIDRELKQVLKLGHASHIIGSIKNAELFGVDNAYLKLENDEAVFCDQILLGTGFDPVINSELVQKLKTNESLKCAECGYPIVDPFLRWHPNLSVTGELAELELGPAAKNIIGARHAGQRICNLL